jgi:hypothetical protein
MTNSKTPKKAAANGMERSTKSPSVGRAMRKAATKAPIMINGCPA